MAVTFYQYRLDLHLPGLPLQERPAAQIPSCYRQVLSLIEKILQQYAEKKNADK